MQIWLVGWGYKIRLSIKAVINCRHNCLGFTEEHNKCLICKGTGVAVAWCPVFCTGLLGSSGFLIFYVAKKKLSDYIVASVSSSEFCLPAVLRISLASQPSGASW